MTDHNNLESSESTGKQSDPIFEQISSKKFNEDNEQIAEMGKVCDQAMQIISAMAEEEGHFGEEWVANILTNLGERKLIHKDIQPFATKHQVEESSAPASAALESEDTKFGKRFVETALDNPIVREFFNKLIEEKLSEYAVSIQR